MEETDRQTGRQAAGRPQAGRRQAAGRQAAGRQTTSHRLQKVILLLYPSWLNARWTFFTLENIEQGREKSVSASANIT